MSMRWNYMPKALCLIQITAEHQDCPCFTVFITIKTSSQNISITLSQISLKLHEHRGCYWRKKLPWTILEEQFPVPRNTAASKIGDGVISLLWQLRCHCKPDHNKFSPSFTTVVAIFTHYMNVGFGKQTFTEFWHVCLEQNNCHAFMFFWRCCSKRLSFISKCSRNKRKTKEMFKYIA